MFNALRDEIDPTIASISTLLISIVSASPGHEPDRSVAFAPGRMNCKFFQSL